VIRPIASDAAVVQRDQSFVPAAPHQVLAAIYSRDGSLIFLILYKNYEFYLIVRFSYAAAMIEIEMNIAC
jgi:dihydroxyacetone kinase